MSLTASEKEISKLEQTVMRAKEKLAKLRQKTPKRQVPDFVLKGAKGKSVHLSELFGKQRDLIVVHNMGSDCQYCALWADGFNGQLKHIQSRTAFVVESPDSPTVQTKLAKSRAWDFKMVSSEGSPFRKLVGFESEEGEPWPGVSTYTRDSRGRIFLVSRSMFGPGDNYCIVWDLFDLLPGGSEKWQPRPRY